MYRGGNGTGDEYVFLEIAYAQKELLERVAVSLEKMTAALVALGEKPEEDLSQ